MIYVAKGLYAGKYNHRQLSDKVHYVKEKDNNKTVCGVDLETSMILTYPMQGKKEEINCKKCVKTLRKEGN